MSAPHRQRGCFVFLVLLLLVLLLLLLHVQADPVETSEEKRLIRKLLQEYEERGKMGRPVAQHDEKLVVSYGLSLIQILDLDERNQILTTNVWATYNWYDRYLKWNPEDYGNVSTIRVPRDSIWGPDIKLYNYADQRLEEKREALAVLQFDGLVVWIPQAIFKSSCLIDIRHFPFDMQTCKLKFGSWTYNGNHLDLEFLYNTSGFEMNDYIPSNEWQIVTSSAKRTVQYYPCCPEPYVDLTFKLRMQRKVAFYSYILILPCVLLSSLTLVLFWLPPESPAKMQLGMNIFVAFFVLLLLLAESTPPAASSIPLIGAYYCLNMILITLSTLLSVVVVNLYFRGSSRVVPRLFKSVMIDVFARIFCMRNQLMEKSDPNKPAAPTSADYMAGYTKNNRDKRYNEFKYDRVGCFEMQMEENRRSLINGTQGLGGEVPPSDTLGERALPPLYSQFSTLEAEIKEIRRHIRHMAERASEKEAKEYIAREWKVVALVLDRLFFFIYLAAIFVSAFTIFETTLMQEQSTDD